MLNVGDVRWRLTVLSGNRFRRSRVCVVNRGRPPLRVPPSLIVFTDVRCLEALTGEEPATTACPSAAGSSKG
jgi:hypothetical protein